MDRKETVYEYLERRTRELTHEIAALKGETDVREKELAHVESAKRQIDVLGGNDAARFGKPSGMQGVAATGTAGDVKCQSIKIEDVVDTVLTLASAATRTARAFEEAKERHPFLQFEGLTIKQLIVKALNDHFPYGATASELRDFIDNAYDRDIERSSLTPQLSRLKDEGFVEYFQPQGDSDAEAGRSKTFVVVRPFKSTTRRFPIGAEIVIPDDTDGLRILKKELEPRDLEDLKARRWIVAPGVGLWRLARQDSDRPKLIEGKAE